MNDKIYKGPEPSPGSSGTNHEIIQKKFLDAEGVKYLWSKINMQDYPNNETLMDVIEAIDETKADKSELFSGSWNDLIDRPFYDELEIVLTIAEHQELTFNRTFYTQTPAAQVSLVNPAEYYNNFPAGKYLIIFDGKHYVLDGINAGISGPPVNFLGNASLAVGEIKNDITYEDNGIPFFVLHQAGGRGWCVYTVDTSVVHTIEIHKVEGELKKIDDKFISDSIARSADVESVFNTLENEINTLAPVAHSNSWNDLNDKPTEFIGRTIIDGRTSTNNTPSASIWYYVSNKTPTLEEFAYGCKLMRTTGEIIKEFTIDDITLGKFLNSSATNNICGRSYFYVLPQDTQVSSIGTLPAGTYFAPIDADGNIQQTSRDISYSLIINGKELIKDEHIPDTIARVSDIPNELHPIAKSGSWDLIENKPLNNIPKATISKPNGSFVSIHLDDFILLSGVMPTLEDFSEGYDVITNYPVETVHYDSSTVLTGDYFDSGFYNVYDSNGQFIIFYEDGKLSDGRDVEKGTYLNTNLITSLIVKPQTVLDPVQIKVDWDGIINKPDNFALREEFHEIARSGSWNDLEDKPFSEEEGQEEIIIDDIPLWVLDESEYLEEPHYNANYTADNNISFVIGDTYRLESDRFLPEGEDGSDYSYPMPLVETVCESETQLSFYSLPIRGGEVEGFLSIECDGTQTISLTSKYINSNIKLIHVGRTVINTLEEKYIPDTIARVSDFSEVSNEEIDAMFA